MNEKRSIQEKLLPAIIQDAENSTVLMLGYMDGAALEKTKAEGRVTFYSRSRRCLWTKGETSGNFLDVQSIHYDCDRDALLIKVKPHGPVCHTGTSTCFSSRALEFLETLQARVKDRFDNRQKDSYTSDLFNAGTPRIAQKVGEEACEVMVAALSQDRGAVISEAADLIFHLLVLLRDKEINLEEVVGCLYGRAS